MIKKWILNNLFINNKLNKIRLRKEYVLSNKNYFDIIYNKTSFLDNNSSMSERLYCILNNIKSKTTCKNINCNNKVNYINFYLGYHRFCSTRCASNDFDVKQKVIKTCNEKYGKNHPQLNDKIRQKSINTIIKKYKQNSFSKTKLFKQKMRDNCIKKSGKDNYMHVNHIKNKLKQTNLIRYGHEVASKNIEIRKNILKRRVDIPENKLDLLFNKKWLEYNHIVLNKSCNEISKEIGIDVKTIYYKFKYFNIPINKNHKSKYEKEIIDFLKSENLIKNSRNIIPPYELDIYLPDYKLAIEFNGLYWHSKFDKNYHINKTNLCEHKGIKLLHIFENEWIDKSNIWKSIINNNLNKNKLILKHTIKKISDINIIKNFINNNSILDVKLKGLYFGVYYLNDLIGIAIINKNNINIFNKINIDFNRNNIIYKIMNQYNIDKLYLNLNRRIFSKINIKKEYSLTKPHKICFNKNNKNMIEIWDCGNIIVEYNENTV